MPLPAEVFDLNATEDVPFPKYEVNEPSVSEALFIAVPFANVDLKFIVVGMLFVPVNSFP